MNINEFQSKRLLEKYGITVPRGRIADSVDEAARIAREIGTNCVVKAQIYAGGRAAGYFDDDRQGKGGVRFARSVDEVQRHAEAMLGHVLVTEQTGPGGREVERVYVEQAYEVSRELYLGMLVDRRTSRVTLVASPEGGVDIESMAMESPKSIQQLAIDPRQGLDAESVRQMVSSLDLDGEQAGAVVQIMQTMYEMFTGLDASLIEINPLAITRAGELIALDATITFDDNALFRHEDIRALRDERELRLGELEAARHGINYVKLDGNIGCMASGAGMSLATIDAIKLFGGEPANFLDVPPVAQVDRVKHALTLILSDIGVESILVNVFGGGIMRCDTIADGIIMANREIPLKVPMVARLAGTNANFAIRRLKDSGPPITFANDLASAAELAVQAAKRTKMTIRRTWWDRVTRIGERA